MVVQEVLTVTTPGRGSVDITDRVAGVIATAAIRTGLCHVFIQHTSASLMLCENADPAVRKDLERFMSRLVADGDPLFAHDTEGPDDMAAHVRTLLTGASLTLPVRDGRGALGVWQGIYVWEHRYHGSPRSVVVTVQGT